MTLCTINISYLINKNNLTKFETEKKKKKEQHQQSLNQTRKIL